MNMLFKTKDEIKRRRCYINIHKAMRIPVDINEKKFTVTVQPKNSCKLEFLDHLWLPFIDQSKYDILVFAIINFQIYNILVSKCKHAIGPIDIIKFNEELYFISTSII